ncbi:MAG: multicopper oxidase family protein [Neisseriaceae bacterium]|nr:multicopper oxidase family protein [Neisseriaceae bacterium]
MKRRDFLKYGIGAGVAATGVFAWARSGRMGGMGHNMNGMGHNMSGMGHGMSGMGGMNHNMGGMGMGAQNLMPVTAMAAGAPLAPLALLPNRSRKLGLFRAKLTAKPVMVTLAGAKQTELWAYNDSVPGPQIVVTEGDRVEITFENQLSQPTTVHWHGLPVPSDQDGNPQDPVAPGQTRIYQFTVPEGSAGTYWYHPHPHGHVSEQVAHGLAGTFIVKAKQDPLAHLPEQHWLISDLRLDVDGRVPENTMLDWMNGREGQFVLVNGQREPKISLSGEHRVRIWNACAARYLRLHIPNCEFILLGTDGGLLEAPQAPVTELFLSPADRVEVVVRTRKPGTYALQSLYYDRSKMMVQETPYTLTLGQVTVGAKVAALPRTLRKINDFGPVVARKRVVFSEEMGGMGGDHSMSGGMGMSMMANMFKVNGQTYDMNRIDLTSKVGEVEEWTVFNNSHMDHPFHLHGTQFMVVSHSLNDRTEPAPYRAYQDTVNLRPYETIVFKVVQHDKGLRMFHCHILEHENLGMMANLNVV